MLIYIDLDLGLQLFLNSLSVVLEIAFLDNFQYVD